MLVCLECDCRLLDELGLDQGEEPFSNEKEDLSRQGYRMRCRYSRRRTNDAVHCSDLWRKVGKTGMHQCGLGSIERSGGGLHRGWDETRRWLHRSGSISTFANSADIITVDIHEYKE
jgi:hypothetical protein